MNVQPQIRANPTYRCHRIDRSLALTGKCDDPLWRTAESIDLVEAAAGGKPDQATTVRVLYDATGLYVAFLCVDSLVWGSYVNRDDPVYTEECVEVFVCPSGDTRSYFEINVSPLNTVFDAAIVNTRLEGSTERSFTGDPSFQCPGLVTRVAVDGEIARPGARGWSAEYSIPFAALKSTPPHVGDEWRINLYRIDEPSPGEIKLSAWSAPGVRDFHIPWRFGTLSFV